MFHFLERLAIPAANEIRKPLHDGMAPRLFCLLTSLAYYYGFFRALSWIWRVYVVNGGYHEIEDGPWVETELRSQMIYWLGIYVSDMVAAFCGYSTLISWKPKDIYIHHGPTLCTFPICIVLDPILNAIDPARADTNPRDFFMANVPFVLALLLSSGNEGWYALLATRSRRPGPTSNMAKRLISLFTLLTLMTSEGYCWYRATFAWAANPDYTMSPFTCVCFQQLCLCAFALHSHYITLHWKSWLGSAVKKGVKKVKKVRPRLLRKKSE